MSSEDIHKLAQELVASRMAGQTDEPTEQAEASVEEQEADEGQSTQEAEEQQELIELKAVGETHKYTIEQLKELASKGLDYTRKTQEIPERVKQETERQVLERTQEVQAERKRLLESCDMIESFYGKPFVTAEQLDQLIQDGNTDEYLRLSRQEEKRREIIDKAKAERQKVLDAEAKHNQDQFKQAAMQHTQLLFEKMPELRDQAALTKLASYLKNAGFTGGEIESFIDHRGLMIAEKARRYDELSASKGKPVEKEAPKVIKKVGATVNKQSYTQKDIEETRSKLTKTGSLRDAASLYMKMQQGVK